MKKLTVNEQEELFAQDCKLINLRYEYSGFTGTEKWAIITELSEEALWDKYPDVISRYTPFIFLSMAQAYEWKGFSKGRGYREIDSPFLSIVRLAAHVS